MLLEGIRLPCAQPLRHARVPLRRDLPRTQAWAHHHPRLRSPADDPGICPPQIPGQLSLMSMPRILTAAHAQRISGRPCPALEVIEKAAVAMQARLGKSAAWRRQVISMTRLAVAAREADEILVREEDLSQLAVMAGRAGEVLRHAGLLRPCPQQPATAPAPRTSTRRIARPAPRQQPWPRQVSCDHCLAWLGTRRQGRICVPCQQWARRRLASPGRCERCARELPVVRGVCRFCHIILSEQPPGAPLGDQLWLDTGPLFTPVPVIVWPAGDSRRLEQQASQSRRQDRPQVTGTVSEHLADPAQLELFHAPRRDWHRLPGTALPALTPAAQDLVEEFGQLARDQSWGDETRDAGLRVLRVLVAWLGAAAPIAEADVRAVARLRPGRSGLRVARFLAAKGLLIAEPVRQASMDEAAVKRIAATVPACFRPEVDAWIRVLRGEGTRPSHAMDWTTIRRYLGYVLPVLRQWRNQEITSLREIATGHVKAAIRGRPHASRRAAHGGLRSLFRALKRERLIFRDPARAVSLPARPRLPRPLPASQLNGLLGRAPTPMAAAAAALAAIHAVRPAGLPRLQLDDLDRSRGRLTIRRPGRNHIVFLDELTSRLLTIWLFERHRRWPASTNPHLFVSLRTAMHPSRPPVSRCCIHGLFSKTVVCGLG